MNGGPRIVIKDFFTKNSDIVKYIRAVVAIIIVAIFTPINYLPISVTHDEFERFYDGVLNFHSAICIGIFISFFMNYMNIYRRAILQITIMLVSNFALIILFILFVEIDRWMLIALLLTVISVFELFRFLVNASKADMINNIKANQPQR